MIFLFVLTFLFADYSTFYSKITAGENPDCIGYHATTSDHYFFSRFIAIAEGENFYYLRTPRESFPYANVNAFIDAHEIIDDSQGNIQKHLVSINTKLFNNADTPQDSTIQIFESNSSVYYTNKTQLVENLFPYLKTEEQKMALKKLFARFKHSEGVILQFFLDREIANEQTYFAGPYGKLYGMGDGRYVPERRLLINKDVALNPKGPLKIVVWDTIPHDVKKSFDAQALAILKSHPSSVATSAGSLTRRSLTSTTSPATGE